MTACDGSRPPLAGVAFSWMPGYARAERLASFPVRAATWALLAGAVVELFCIARQAAREWGSRFDTSRRVGRGDLGDDGADGDRVRRHARAAGLGNRATPPPDAAPLMIAGIVLGLALTVVPRALTGARMGRFATGAVAPPEWIVPIAGWRIAVGSLRIAHFLGADAMQASPSMAWRALFLPGPPTVGLFVPGALGYCATTLALFRRASRAAAMPVGDITP